MSISPTIARCIVAPEQPITHCECPLCVLSTAGAGGVQAGPAVAVAAWVLYVRRVCRGAPGAFAALRGHVNAVARHLGELLLQAGGVEDFVGDRAARHGVASGGDCGPSTLHDQEA